MESDHYKTRSGVTSGTGPCCVQGLQLEVLRLSCKAVTPELMQHRCTALWQNQDNPTDAAQSNSLWDDQILQLMCASVPETLRSAGTQINREAWQS